MSLCGNQCKGVLRLRILKLLGAIKSTVADPGVLYRLLTSMEEEQVNF
jgi:hypothetical protein